MFKINNHPKGYGDFSQDVPSGFQITFENGNTISVQFGFGNYCENRDESKSECATAEIAIWNKDGKWYDFGSDTVKGWCTPDEVGQFIQLAMTTTI